MGHHWKIEAATGPTSPGVCLECGELREFQNSLQNSGYGKTAGSLEEQKARIAYLARHDGDVARASIGTGMGYSDLG